MALERRSRRRGPSSSGDWRPQARAHRNRREVHLCGSGWRRPAGERHGRRTKVPTEDEVAASVVATRVRDEDPGGGSLRGPQCYPFFLAEAGAGRGWSNQEVDGTGVGVQRQQLDDQQPADEFVIAQAAAEVRTVPRPSAAGRASEQAPTFGLNHWMGRRAAGGLQSRSSGPCARGFRLERAGLSNHDRGSS